MQEVAVYKTTLQMLDESDEEALGYFNNLNPNLEEEHFSRQPSEEEELEDYPRLGRLSKLKKDIKMEKEKHKTNKPKAKKLSKFMQYMEATPIKKLKSEKLKKKRKGSDGQQASINDKGDRGSSEQDSFRSQLENLHPDSANQQSPKKRLRKSNRKDRIQDHEGFRIQELGNDPEVDLEKVERKYQDQDYSFDDIERKKSKARKAKAAVPTNEQIMRQFRQRENGVVESEGEEKEGMAYDNGLDMLYSMKDKRKNAIKVNNRLFENIQFDSRNQQDQVPLPQSLQLEIKPKLSTSSRVSFLSKAENIKRNRGLEADGSKQQYQRKAGQRAKISIAKVVSSMVSQDFHEEIDLEVKVPLIARGKSADIINNTVFLKRYMSRDENRPASPEKDKTQINIKNLSLPRHEAQTRHEFYKRMEEQTKLNRSKYISQEQFKNSFKKTNLDQLEQARKRILQKKRKEALSEGSDEEQYSMNESERLADQDLQQMIQKQERACQIRQQSQEAEVLNQVQEMPFQEKIETLKEDQQIQAEDEIQNDGEEGQSEINEFNEVIDELASVSERHQEQQIEEQLQQEQGEESESIESQIQKELAQNAEQQLKEEIEQPNPEQRRQMMEFQQQGISLKRNKKLTINQDQIVNSQKDNPQKQNVLGLSNLPEQMVQQQAIKSKYLIEDDQQEEFKNFKKLRKIAMVIAEKKKEREKGRRYAAEFIENQAEEGSDNEDHDDLIKKIDYAAEDKEFEGMNLDEDLAQLIDNAVDINQEDEFQAFRKYLEDVRIRDREEIKKIIRGEFHHKHEDLELEVEEDERKRQERMENVVNWIKRREQEEGAGIYLKPSQKQSNEENGFDEDDSEYERKPNQQQPEEESQQIPIQQQDAMFQKFMENTLPTATKKQARSVKTLDFGILPESIKLQRTSSLKTISMSRLGSKASSDCVINPHKTKKTSSLVNEILNGRKQAMWHPKPMANKLTKGTK